MCGSHRFAPAPLVRRPSFAPGPRKPTSHHPTASSGQTFASTHDPIYARALIIDNGKDKVALITTDVTELPNGDDLVKAVSDALHITPANLIMSATHNHNAPTGGRRPGEQVWDTPYYLLLKAGILSAATSAESALPPARIVYGSGLAYVNVNRDEKIGAGYHMGFNPTGPSDKAVADTVGVPEANVVIFSSHTHSNPLVFYHGRDGTPAQMRTIAKTRAGAIAAAMASLQPARIVL